MSVIAQEGLFNCPQLGCVNPRCGSMVIGTRMKWTTTVKAIGQDDWPVLRKSKKIEKSSLRPQFAEAAEQLQRLKKRKKVSWNRLDCQDELHKSMTYNKFTTLTPGEKGAGSLLLRIEYSSPGDLCQKKGKRQEKHRHAREGPRKSCWWLRQEFFRRSACMGEGGNRNRQGCVRQCDIARTRS